MHRETINNEELLFVKLHITFKVELTTKIGLSLNAMTSVKIARKDNHGPGNTTCLFNENVLKFHSR